MKKLRILFVTTDEYPTFGTTCNLINKIIFDGGLLKGNKIGVLSLCNEFTQKHYEVVDGVHIYRVLSSWGVRGDKFWKELNKLPFNNRVFTLIEKVIISIYEVLGSKSRLVRPTNVYWLSKALKKIVKNNYDIVIPISGVYDSVKAVLNAEIKAKKVFWQVDPCSTNYTRIKREKGLSKTLEQRIFKEFDAVITDEIYYNEYKKIYGKSFLRKVHTINMPLIASSSLDITESIKEKGIQKKEIRCVFTGLIYLGIRDPGYTVNLFNELGRNRNVRLHLFGPSNNDVPYNCSKSIVFHGKVDAGQAKKEMMDADFLVNIGNKMDNQIPSKVYEYISTGLPIINICKNRNCPSIDLLKDYPNAITIMEDEDRFSEQLINLERFIDEKNGKRVTGTLINTLYYDYSPERCGKVFKEILCEL